MTQGTRERTSLQALDDDAANDSQPGATRDFGVRDATDDDGLPPPPMLPEALHQQRLAQLESGLVLDDRSPDEQPFVRCAQCETDAPRGAIRCRTCNTALGTPEQAVYNQALWVRLRAEKEQELARQEALLDERGEARPASLEQLQREMGEAIAEEVRARRSPRLGWRGGMALDAQGYRPLGLRLLERLRDSGMRAWLLLGALGFAATMLWHALQRHGHGRSALVVVGMIALAVFLLPSPRAGEPPDET